MAQASVVLEAPRVADHVAVEAHDVVAGGAGHRLVADGGQPEPLVGVPHVMHRTGAGGPVPLDDGARRGPAAVVGHDDLEGGLGLPPQGVETGVERVRPVVGGDDDRDGGHERPAPRYSS